MAGETSSKTGVRRRSVLEVMGAAAVVSGVAKPGHAALNKSLDVKLDIEGYKVTDTFFGTPYLDVDEMRDDYVRHRFIHGGFEGTGTRFSVHFPEADIYQGRFLQPLEGGTAGNEYAYGAPAPGTLSFPGGLDTAVRLGAYLVQSNQGHHGTEKCPKGKDDVTIYGHRASAEVGRFARYLAAQVYGERPRHGYVFGGSGGGKRSPTCLEQAPDVWSGCLPFMGGAQVDPENVEKPMIATQIIFYTALLNVQRMLGDKLKQVVDAVEPGGSGDPFAGLNVDQRQALADLYRCGFPRGAEFLVDPDNYTGQIYEWAWSAEEIHHIDPTYFTDFWTKPGYGGHDTPHLFEKDIINTEITVGKVITAGELAKLIKTGGPEGRSASAVSASRGKPENVVGIALSHRPDGYMVGAGLEFLDGAAKGRKLYCTVESGSLIMGGALGEAGNLRFNGVKAGDRIKITNRDFMAYCHWYRHHVVTDNNDFRNEMVDGEALYPQRDVQVPATVFTGGRNTAQFEGKMLWYQHTHDAAVWPATAFYYRNEVYQAMGEETARARGFD